MHRLPVILMMMLPQKDIYYFSVLLMTVVGEKLHYTSTKLKLFRFLNCGILLFLSVLVFLNIFYTERKMFVQAVESNVIVLHTLLKYTAFMYYKSDIEELLDISQHRFWKYPDFSKNSLSVTYNPYKRTKCAQLIIIGSGYAVITLFLLRPLFNHSIVFFVEPWRIKDSVIFDSTILMLEYYISYIMVSTVFGYDALYLAFSVDIVLQLRLLKYKLHNLYKYCGRKLGVELDDCIKHHQLLLRAFKRIKAVFSMMLFFHYFVTLVASCIELYEFILIQSTSFYALVKLFSVFTACLEFAFYTFPAEQITFEFHDISKQIYLSKWYCSTTNIQRKLLLVLTRCQRSEYFSGGGIININIETFGLVIRRSVSFYAVLRNLLNK